MEASKLTRNDLAHIVFKTTDYKVDSIGFFKSFIIAAKLNTLESMDEQLHNIFDNGGVNIDINHDAEKKTLKIQDYTKNGIVDPTSIMESLKKKQNDNQLNQIGNYNYGEVASVFNLGKSCLYLCKDNVFKIIVKDELPVMIHYNLDKLNDDPLIKELGLECPECGTIKVFNGVNITIDDMKNDMKDISKRTNIPITCNGEELEQYKYITDNAPIKYNVDITLFGKYNKETGEILWYKKVEGKIYIELKNLKKWKKNRNYEQLHGKKIEKEDNYFDVKYTSKMAIHPSKNNKNNNESGMRYIFENGNGKYVTLLDQKKLAELLKFCLPSYTSRNGVYKDLEIVGKLNILKNDNQKEIYSIFTTFPIKSKTPNLCNNVPIRIMNKYCINHNFEIFLNNFKNDTGEESFGNDKYAEDGTWYRANGKGYDYIITKNIREDAAVKIQKKFFRGRTVRARMRAAAVIQKVFRGRTVRVKEHYRNKPVTIGEIKVYLNELSKHFETLQDSQFALKGNDIKKIRDEILNK
jgi:hypothetical protein